MYVEIKNTRHLAAKIPKVNGGIHVLKALSATESNAGGAMKRSHVR